MVRRAFFLRLLGVLERFSPDWASRLQIRILHDMTARAFARKESSGRWFWRSGKARTAEDALACYAAFTVRCFEEARADAACCRRLYMEAFRTGFMLRRLTGFTDSAKISRLVFYLYRNIGIAMDGHIPGTIEISGCYFSNFYTPKMCELMSYLDSGIIAGLSGGGRLRFFGRITEGCGRCTACFAVPHKNRDGGGI